MPKHASEAVTDAPAAPSARASWSGLLRLSLVAVPVKAYPAVATSESVHLNQLHRDCGQRIGYQKHCPVHGRVEAGQIVKAYQYAPDQYVNIEPDELDKIRPAQDKALNLEQFVEPESIEPVRLSGRTLYLLPHGVAAQRPYHVLAEALEQRGRWALGRVTMSGHRYGVVVRADNSLLSMSMLHDPVQVRSAAGFCAQLREEGASDQERKLATMLIDASSGPIDWSVYRDDAATQLERLVEAKVAGREVSEPAEEPVQVLQLMEALQKSVDAAQKSQRPRCAKPKPKPKQKPKRSARRKSA